MGFLEFLVVIVGLNFVLLFLLELRDDFQVTGIEFGQPAVFQFQNHVSLVFALFVCVFVGKDCCIFQCLIFYLLFNMINFFIQLFYFTFLCFQHDFQFPVSTDHFFHVPHYVLHNLLELIHFLLLFAPVFHKYFYLVYVQLQVRGQTTCISGTLISSNGLFQI